MVEAYLKTPQPDGPQHSLVGFERIHHNAGESCDVELLLNPRLLSSVDDQGRRSVLAGIYHLCVGAAQPEETRFKSEATFLVKRTASLPK